MGNRLRLFCLRYRQIIQLSYKGWPFCGILSDEGDEMKEWTATPRKCPLVTADCGGGAGDEALFDPLVLNFCSAKPVTTKPPENDMSFQKYSPVISKSPKHSAETFLSPPCCLFVAGINAFHARKVDVPRYAPHYFPSFSAVAHSGEVDAFASLRNLNPLASQMRLARYYPDSE